jgi:hypothetical protein
MLAAFRRGTRQREILDLTAPADDGDGIVDRWLRETTARAGSDAPAKGDTAPQKRGEPAG